MKFSKFFVPFFFYQALYAAGFASETCIWTESGLIRLDELAYEDRIVGLHENKLFSCNKSSYMKIHKVTQLIAITVGSFLDREKILTDLDQQFCCADGSWVEASHLKKGDILEGYPCSVEVKKVKEISTDPDTIVCTVGMDDEFGCFYVSRHKLLVYNYTSQKFWKPIKRVTKNAAKVGAEMVLGPLARIIV